MRELARLGFILVGLRTALLGASALASSLSLLRHDEFGFAPIMTAIQVLFVVLPGLALVFFNRGLAEFLFSEAPPTVGALDLVAAGLAVLGAYLIIVGVSGAVSFLFMAVLNAGDPSWGLSWGGLLGGLLHTAFGVLLFRHPQAVLQYVGRFDPTRAA